jgi:hypothetical protein
MGQHSPARIVSGSGPGILTVIDGLGHYFNDRVYKIT